MDAAAEALGRGRSVRQARQIWRCADGRPEVAAYVNSLERPTKDRRTAERLNVSTPNVIFAAVVYGVKDNPDRLLLDFTEGLRCSGVRTAGLVQLDSWSGQSNDQAVHTVVLSTREVIPVAHERNLVYLQRDAGSTAESWQALRK
jgi:hypothetical protein